MAKAEKDVYSSARIRNTWWTHDVWLGIADNNNWGNKLTKQNKRRWIEKKKKVKKQESERKY